MILTLLLLLQEGPGPWDADLVAIESKDGLRFADDSARLFVARAGVPHLYRDRDKQIVAVFQWFPKDDRKAFNSIARAVSKDEGKTWSKPEVLSIRGLPSKHSPPCDACVVPLDDGTVRMYFTVDLGRRAHCASALSKDGIAFDLEKGERFRADENVLDPFVFRLGDVWHYVAPRHGKEGRNFHAISKDGLAFERQKDLDVGFHFLGAAVPTRDGVRFYGTGRGGIVSATTTDGFAWKVEDGVRCRGADPGVLAVGDRVLLIYPKRR